MADDRSLRDALVELAETGDVPRFIEFVMSSRHIPDDQRSEIADAWRNVEIHLLSPKQIERATAKARRQAERDALVREIRAADDRLIAEGVGPAEMRAERLEEMFPIADRYAVGLGRDMINIIGKSEADLIPPRSGFHRRLFGEAFRRGKAENA